MKTLVFTFRTFPYIAQLKSAFKHVFVFGELKKDLSALQKLIDDEKPKLIFGVALTTGMTSVFERRAVNVLHGRKIKGNKDSHALELPDGYQFISLSTNQTTSFCNWTAYRIAEHLHATQSTCKLTFCHVIPSDVAKLIRTIKSNDCA